MTAFHFINRGCTGVRQGENFRRKGEEPALGVQLNAGPGSQLVRLGLGSVSGGHHRQRRMVVPSLSFQFRQKGIEP
eukprot:3484691-Amphidinium_carterae.1